MQPRPGKRLRTSDEGSSRSAASNFDDEGIEVQDPDEDEGENDPEEEEAMREAATQRVQNEERVRRERDAGVCSLTRVAHSLEYIQGSPQVH